VVIGALPYLIWSRIVNKKVLLLVYYVGFFAGIFFYTAICMFSSLTVMCCPESDQVLVADEGHITSILLQYS
jgi:hypothetical protein